MTGGPASRYLRVTYEEAPIDQPGERLPLLTRGEAEVLMAVLAQTAEAEVGLRAVALELQSRNGMRLPAP